MREAERNRIFALLLLDRLDEGEALCGPCINNSQDPALRAHASSGKAILYARLHGCTTHGAAILQQHVTASPDR